MKISHKLTLGYSVFALLVGVVGLFGLDASKSMLQSYHDVNEEFQAEVYAAIEAQSFTKRAEGHLFLYLTLGDESDKEKFFKRYRLLQEQVQILEKTVTTTSGTRQVLEMKKFTDELLELGTQLIAAHDNDPATFNFEDNKTLIQQFHGVARTLREHGGAIAKRRTIDSAIETAGYAKRAESHLILYLTLGAEEDREKFFNRYQYLVEQYEILEKAVTSPKGLHQLNILQLSSDDILKHGKQLIEVYDNSPATFNFKDHEALIKQFHDATSTVRKQGVAIAKSEKNLITGNSEELQERALSIQKKIISIIIVSIIAALLLGIYFVYSVARPLKKLTDAVTHLGENEYEIIEGSRSNDEIGILTRSFNEMSRQLAQHHSHLDELVYESTSELIATNEKYLEEINERRSLQEQLIQAQKMEAIGHLAGGIAHDFNNILSAIIGYTELALIEAAPGSSVKDRLAKVRESSNRAAQLVKQILDFSRQTNTKPVPVVLYSIIKEVLRLMRATIPTTIEIQQDIVEECTNAIVMADQTKMHQVFLNLCTNASHAMHEKGGVLRVAAALEKIGINNDLVVEQELSPGDYIRIEISDTGYGIAEDNLKKIFEPYFTTKRKDEGTGLGLAVVHGIVKSYNGAITVSSRINEGTTFNVFLPITSTDSALIDKSLEEEIPQGHEHILVIDDEEILASMYKETLASLGYQVTVRTSSIEALQLFKSRPDGFDLILTDMTMPNMTGSDLAKEILSTKPSMPIILCTGFSSTIDEEKALRIGIKGYIHKPLLVRELANLIRNVLKGRDT